MNIFELVGQIALEGIDKAQTQLNGLEGYAKKNEKAFKAIGAAMTGAGVAITGALALSVKSAAEEEAGIIKLTAALKNVGVSYDEVKESLEANIDATQQKTSTADDQQRESLANLVAITGDYNKALELLPLTLDLAAGKDMDLAAAADVVGRVAEGNVTILTRYGIQLKAGATATEALGELQAKYGGQAEAYGRSVAGQFALIKNNIGDVMEAIGGTLIPVIKDLFADHINPLIQSLKAWAAEHPELLKAIVIIAGAIGALMLVLGPLLIMLPGLSAGIAMFGTVIAIATGPVGLIILAITALVAGVTALALAWSNNWGDIRGKAESAVEAIVHTVGWMWDKILWYFGLWVDAISWVLKALSQLVNFFSHDFAMGMYDTAEKITKGFEQFRDKSVSALTDFDADFKKTTETISSGASKIGSAMNALGTTTVSAAQSSSKGWSTAAEKIIESWNKIKEAAKSTAEAVGGGGMSFAQAMAEGAYAGIVGGQPYYAWEEAPGYIEGIRPDIAEQAAREMAGYQHGGPILGDTLLTNLQTMKPYAVAHGGESVVPKGGQTANIIVMLDGKTIAKALGQPLVDEIRVKTGVKI